LNRPSDSLISGMDNRWSDQGLGPLYGKRIVSKGGGIVRWVVLVALLLALVGCQLGAPEEPAPTTSTTSAFDVLRAKQKWREAAGSTTGLENDVVPGSVSPTTQPREGDGICTHEERDGGVDCRQRSAVVPFEAPTTR
jgi:hypothetical protein